MQNMVLIHGEILDSCQKQQINLYGPMYINLKTIILWGKIKT